MNTSKIKDLFHKTMLEIAKQIEINDDLIDINEIDSLIHSILKIKDNDSIVFVYGAGRSGFVGRCFAQRLMHLGIKSCFISDAITYPYTKNDLLIIISGSGETLSPVALAKKAKEIGGNIALLTSNINSSIGKISDLIIKVEGKSKDKAFTLQTYAPYTSLFDISALSILDSIGGILKNILGLNEADIDHRHASIE